MREDAYLWTRNHDIAVEVMAWVDNRQLVPLVDELGNHFGDVRTRRLFPRPQSGAVTSLDWDFIASVTVWLTAVGGIEFLRKVIGLLAEDTYRGLRRKLLKTRQRSSRWRRVMNGVVIRIGSHHFVFDQSINDDEFRTQLRAAQDILDRSPAPLLTGDDPDGEWRPWRWDETARRWRTSGARLAAAVGEEPRKAD